MALSGSFGNTFRTGYRIQVDWSATQSIAGNSSTITASFYLISLGSTYSISSSATKSGSVVIGGQTDSFSGAGLAGVSGNQTKLLRTTTFTVGHNSDGSLTTNIYAAIGLNVTLSGVYWGTVDTSSDITLDTIARASTINAFGNFTINGTAIPMTLVIASTAFNHDVTLKIGNTVVKAINFAAAAVPASITLSAGEQNTLFTAMPSSTTATVTLEVVTKNGSTQIGDTQVRNVTATIDTATQKPTGLSISNSETATITGYGGTAVGVYVEWLSRLQSILNATAPTGATISSKSIAVKSGATVLFSGVSPLISGAFATPGTITIEGTATDSRGASTTTSTTITVVTYDPPVIDTALTTVYRCTSGGVADPNGTYIKARIKGNITGITNTTQRNNLFYTLRQRVKGTTPWSTTNAIATVTHTYGTLTVDFTSAALGAGTYATANGYEFQIEVKDYFNILIYEVSISGNTVMSWSKTGVGIGKVWAQGALDVSGAIYQDGVAATATAGTANSIVKRDASGYINNTWFNSNRANEATAAASYLYDTGDGYMRKKTLANARAEIAGGNTADVNADVGISKMMRWKNYGNNHVIFDASNSTSPTGSAVNNTNPVTPWAASYPSLMGWNGTQTYGLRVDSCRTADTAKNPGAYNPFSWEGTLPGNGNEYDITHNLGYPPIVMFEGTRGNLQFTFIHISVNVIRVCQWNSGGNTWTGMIRCY